VEINSQFFAFSASLRFNYVLAYRRNVVFMLELFARAFNLGLVATIMPGPLQTLAINSALSHGWRKSLLIGIAPLLSDLPIIFIVLFFLRQFPPEFLSIMRLVGGVFLLNIAWERGASIAGAQR
jgi:threonine/homoserine/homoserine lactone efflux protein